MNNITVRRAEKKDIQRLFELLTQICDFHCKGRPDIFRHGQKYSEDELEEILENPKGPVFVAVDSYDAVLGYAFCIHKECLANPVMKDHLTIYIDDLCVDEKCRGMGLGKTLFEAVKSYALSVGAYNIDLNVWEFPGSATGFYEQLGMKTERRYMEFIL
jgi:GNAT superfamily N-acetyltransferase